MLKKIRGVNLGSKRWSNEEVEYLKKNIRKRTVEQIAKKLGRSVSSVQNKCTRSGIYKERWSDEEKDFLREYAGEKSVSWIARKLKRGRYAVEQKINRMGMTYKVDNGKISLYLLVHTLGYASESFAYRKLEKLGLKIYKVQKKNNKVKMVDINEFWKWAEKNQENLNFKNLEHNAFGYEPEWAKEKIDRDTKYKIKYKQNEYWTKDEEELLIGYMKIGLNSLEISKRLGRSERSIDAKVRRLNTYYRPNIQDVKKWKEEEEALLIRSLEEGKSWDEIGCILNRTTKSVKAKYIRMKNEKETA